MQLSCFWVINTLVINTLGYFENLVFFDQDHDQGMVENLPQVYDRYSQDILGSDAL
jgi:hypothetical protein